MPELKQILDDTYHAICVGADARHTVRQLEHVTVSIEDVVAHIYPFYESLTKYRLRDDWQGDVEPVLDITAYITEKYFNQVKENGYYKSEKADFYRHWFCTDCECFFNLVPVLDKHRKPTEVQCTHCNSTKTINSDFLKSINIDTYNTVKLQSDLGERQQWFEKLKERMDSKK